MMRDRSARLIMGAYVRASRERSASQRFKDAQNTGAALPRLCPKLRRAKSRLPAAVRRAKTVSAPDQQRITRARCATDYPGGLRALALHRIRTHAMFPRALRPDPLYS